MAISILGEAAVRLRPETTGFKADAESGILGPIGGIAKAATGLFAAAFAGGAIVNGFKSFYDAAAESARIGRLTNQVIQSTGGAANVSADQVGNLVTAISNKTGVDDEAIQSGANLLLTFTNIKNAAGAGNDIFTQTTQIMTDMSAALGTDASGSAIQLGKALNDPVKGVSALQKVGVSFTQSQKDQIKTLVDSGNTLGAQKIILGELNREFGGAAAAASTPLDKLKVNLGNLQEAIGAGLIPVVSQFASFAVTTLLPGLYRLGGYIGDNLGPIFVTIKDAVLGFIGAFTGQGSDALDHFSGPVMNRIIDAAAVARSMWDNFAGFVTGTLIPAIEGLVPVFAAIGQAVFAVVAFFVDHQNAAIALGVVVGGVATLIIAAWVAQGVAATINAAKSVIAWFAVATGAQVAADGSSRSTAQIVTGWIIAGAQAVWNAAKVVAGWVLMGAAAVAQGLIIAGVWTAQIVASAVRGAISLGITVLEVIGGWVLMAAAAIAQAAIMAAAWFIALGPIGWVIAAVIGLVALIVANWDTVVSWTTIAWQAVVGAVTAAWEWIKGAVQAALDFVINIFLNWTLLGLIISHWEAIKAVFIAGVDAAVGFVTGLPQRIVNALAALGALIAGVASAAWQWFYDTVAVKIAAAEGFVAGLPGRILRALGGLGSLLVGVGGDLIRGLVNGIASAANFVGDIARNVVNAIIRFINTHMIDGINGLLNFTIAGIHINVPDIPHIPTLHEGGIFTAPAGEGLAVLRNNELVVTPEQRATADNLLTALLGGTLPVSSSTTNVGGGVTINQQITQLPGESAVALAARVSDRVVFNLNNGVTATVGAGATP